MDLWDLRSRNMLFGQPKPNITMPSFGAGPIELPEVEAPEFNPPANNELDYMSMYNQPSPALEAYKQHITNLPDRTNYKAGVGNKIAAALIGASEGLNKGGFAGYSAARSFLDSPYQMDLEAYKNKGSVLGQLAEIESNDVKRKIDYVSQTLKDRRENQKFDLDKLKTLSDINRADSLNKLTAVQISQINNSMGLAGKELQRNTTDGQLYLIDKKNGSSQALGQFDETPTQKGNREVNIHSRKSGIDLENKKNFFNFETPINQANAIERIDANRIAAQKRRAFDAANPIQSNMGLQPSQSDIAFKNAVTETVLKNPQWAKFVDENLTSSQREEFANDPEYDNFITAVEDAKRATIANRNPNNSMTVSLPGQSPLNSPTSNPIREAAIAQLKKDGQPVNETTINWLMNHPAFKSAFGK